MDQMIGDWSMVRGNGQTICGLTLTNTEATGDNFQVFLKPKCDPAVAAFAPNQWRLDHGRMLLLSAKGDTGSSRPMTMRSGGGCPTRPIP
jgi:hypothetical protein